MLVSSRSCPTRHEPAKSYLGSLPSTDIPVWTDGSVPSAFGPGGAGVHIICNSCSTTTSLSSSAGPVCSSFTAESVALEHGLHWCLTHLSTCHFQSILFLTDSQSALFLLTSSPTFLLPASVWNVLSLIFTLSPKVELVFQWVPGPRHFLGMNLQTLWPNQAPPFPPVGLNAPLALYPRNLDILSIPF